MTAVPPLLLAQNWYRTIGEVRSLVRASLAVIKGRKRVGDEGTLSNTNSDEDSE
jgi:hypothetical protein